MSGEELKKKLKSAGISQAEIASRLGVIPQSVGQTLEAKDVKTGFLEDLCRVFNVDMSFFYGGEASAPSEPYSRDKELKRLNQAIIELEEDNKRLKEELRMKDDPERPRKESEVYRIWMDFMRITERMQELYQRQKGE